MIVPALCAVSWLLLIEAIVWSPTIVKATSSPLVAVAVRAIVSSTVICVSVNCQSMDCPIGSPLPETAIVAEDTPSEMTMVSV